MNGLSNQSGRRATLTGGRGERPCKLGRRHFVAMAVFVLGLLGCVEFMLIQSHHQTSNSRKNIPNLPPIEKGFSAAVAKYDNVPHLLEQPEPRPITPFVRKPPSTTTKPTEKMKPAVVEESPDNTDTSSSLKHLAIVIPFRDSTDPRSQGINREKNLQQWLDYMSDYLRPQLREVTTVYVIEQSQGGIFNKGLLFNAGFDYITKTDPTIDYFVFHDVDQVPRDHKCANCYDYRSSPTKLIRETTRVEGNRQLRRKLSPSNVGGALMITPEVYRKVNGYSNVLAGWGIEDDNMAYRIKRFNGGFRVLTPGKFKGLPHPRVPGLDATEQFEKNTKNMHEIGSGLSDLTCELSGETRAVVKNLSVVRVVVTPLQ